MYNANFLNYVVSLKIRWITENYFFALGYKYYVYEIWIYSTNVYGWNFINKFPSNQIWTRKEIRLISFLKKLSIFNTKNGKKAWKD